MSISISLIQKLNSALGICGRPHKILYNGVWIDTGCMEWSQSPSLAEVGSSIRPELKDAMRRFEEYLQHTDPRASLDEFLESEPPEIKAQYQEYIVRHEEANDPFPKMPPLPEISPDLQNAIQRVEEKLQKEEFMVGDRFDLDRYNAKAKELWQDEPPAIQAEVAALAAKIEELQAIYLRKNRKQNRTLKQVRALLGDESVMAYKAGIMWEGMPSTGYNTIVVASAIDQFDILRFERTNGANRGLQTEDLIEKLKFLDEQHGIDIVGAGIDGVEFNLKQIPKGKAATDLGSWLLNLCPDLYEAPRVFPKGKVSLWWD